MEAISLDTTSITPVGDSTYRVWERFISRQADGVRALARAEFDCRYRQTRGVAVALPGFEPVELSGKSAGGRRFRRDRCTRPSFGGYARKTALEIAQAAASGKTAGRDGGLPTSCVP
jgi:hypothetical protein